MKKELIITYVLSIILVLFITINSYYVYKNKVNQFVVNVIENINENYPNIETSDLVKIINSDIEYDNVILKDYGISDSDISILYSINKEYIHNLIINISLLVLFLVIITIYYLKKERRYNKGIEEIITYLEKINNGIYDLDLLDNKEGLETRLKNEIYTTTILLRETALREQKAKRELKEAFSNISHQLKTPLTSILLMLDNLIEEDMPIELQQSFLKDIKKQIENINFYIISMLKLSRFDANVITLKEDTINIYDVIKNSLANLDIIREIKNINILFDGKKDIFIKGDYHWVLEAINNIVKNAIEYTPEYKNIYITLEDNSIYTKLIIQDEGKGIDKKDLPYIFERYYRGSNEQENNFGIGLALAKEIITQTKGTIYIESYGGEGTRFIIKFFH